MGIGQRWRSEGDAISNGDDNKWGGDGGREIGHPIYVLLGPFGPELHQTIARARSSRNLSRKIGLRSAFMQVADGQGGFISLTPFEAAANLRSTKLPR